MSEVQRWSLGVSECGVVVRDAASHSPQELG